MLVEKLTIPIARNGLNKDLEPTDLEGNYSPNMQNMMVRPSKIVKRLGYSQLGRNLPLEGIGQELVEYVDARGTVHLIALTTVMAYEYNAATQQWLAIKSDIQLQDCNDHTDWTPDGTNDITVTTDTDDKKESTGSIKMTVGAGGAIPGNFADTTVFRVVDSGTTDGVEASKLIDAGQNFETTVNVGDRVKNVTDTTFTSVTAVDSNSALSIADDLFIIGDEYEISHADLTAYTAKSCVSFWFKTSKAGGSIQIVIYDADSDVSRQSFVASKADTWYHFCGLRDLSTITKVTKVEVWGVSLFDEGDWLKIDDIRVVAGFSGDADDRWSHAEATDISEFTLNGGQALIISNGVDKLYYFEGQDGDKFQYLDISGTWSDFAHTKEIEEFWNHFFCFNYNDSEQNVKSLAFADLGDIVDWTGGTSDSIFLSDSRGAIMRAKKLSSDMIIYSAKSIATCRYIGTQLIFAIPTLVYETGLYCTKGIWDFVNAHYFLGTDQKVYEYSGGRHLAAIGEAIEDSLFGQLDAESKAKVVTGLDGGRHKLYFFIPRESDDYSKIYYALNHKMQNKPWEYGEFYHDVRDFSVFENAVNRYCDDEELTDLYCDEIDMYCDSAYVIKGNPIATFISSSGYVYQLDATASDAGEDVEAIYDTEEVTPDGEYVNCRWQRFYFTAKANIVDSTVRIYYSITDDVWVELVNDSPISLTNAWATYSVGVDVLARKIKFRFYQKSKKDLQIRDPMHVEYIRETAYE